MKSAAILAAGAVAFALLAFFCLPHHAPPAAVLATPIPANFHARVEYGTLILRGSLPSETSKAAIIHRAQELYGAAPGSVVDELTVDPRMGPVAWAENVSQIIPALGHMTERGAIIIDGRTIVVSGQVGGNRAKAAVLQAIAPLTETGLELEDRILGGSSFSGPLYKSFCLHDSIPEISSGKGACTDSIAIPKCAFHRRTIPVGSLSEDALRSGGSHSKDFHTHCPISKNTFLGSGPRSKNPTLAGNFIGGRDLSCLASEEVE